MSDKFIRYPNVIWSLPLLFGLEPIWIAMYDILKNFKIEPPKANLFGCPPCKWTGGRVPDFQGRVELDTILRLFKFLKPSGAVPTFTFSGTQLTKEDLKDEYCNALLDMALETNARYIIFDDRLKDYIKNKKPEAEVVASVIKPQEHFLGPERSEKLTVENETNFYNKLLKEYDVVVVRPEYSMTTLVEHPEYINDISRIEVLINQICVIDCPRTINHYRYLESMKEEYNHPGYNFQCHAEGKDPLYHLNYNTAHEEETVKKLVEHGVKHLKLEGRGESEVYISTKALMLFFYMYNPYGKYHLLTRDMGRNVEDCVDLFRRVVVMGEDIKDVMKT